MGLPSPIAISIARAWHGLVERGELIPAILGWQDRCWRGIESAAAAGDPAMRRLVNDRVPDQIRRSYAWTEAHQHELTSNQQMTRRRRPATRY
jgi:hypothetical protein